MIRRSYVLSHLHRKKRENYIMDLESLTFVCAVKKNNADGFKPVKGCRPHFGYMSGVLWGRPGQNMRPIRVLV
jgi:hypothetical protein